MRFLDVTVRIGPEIPSYEGDPVYKRRVVQSMTDGKPADVSMLTLSAHAATHVDAPSHLILGGKTVDQLELDVLIGPACVVEYEGRGPIPLEFMKAAGIRPEHERILFKTRNSALWGSREFVEDYVGISREAANWLVHRGVRLIGIDYLSVDPPGDSDLPIHRILLSNGIVVVEGLDLSTAEQGEYILLCLPVKIEGCEGAPARVVLIPTSDS